MRTLSWWLSGFCLGAAGVLLVGPLATLWIAGALLGFTIAVEAWRANRDRATALRRWSTWTLDDLGRRFRD